MDTEREIESEKEKEIFFSFIKSVGWVCKS